MPPEIEKVVLPADGARPEHILPEERQPCLESIAGRQEDASSLRRVLPRVRKGTAIDLTAGRQGQGGQAHEGRRDHRFRQTLSQETPQLPLVRRRLGPGDPVSHQASLARWTTVRCDRGLTHLRMPRQRGLDLPQLDPESPDLDLGISSPGELDAAVGEQASDVPGAIDPSVPSLGVGKKGRPRQIGPAPVAEGDMAAADGDLAADLTGLAPGAEQQDLGVLDGPSERHRGPPVWGRPVDEVLQRDGRLRRPITVHEQTAAGGMPPAGLDVLAADLLPSEDDESQIRRQSLLRQRFDQVPEHSGRRVVDGDTVPAHSVSKTGETGLADVDRTQRRAVQERPENIHDRGVDAVR